MVLVVREWAGMIARETFLNPTYLCAVAVILLLERLIPADRKQPVLSVGLWHDLVWVGLTLIVQAAVVAVYAQAITYFVKTHLQVSILQGIRQWPEGARFVLGVFVGDFLAWGQHRLKHAVPWFWQFHAVHHSQKEINLFTDYRFHWMEFIISSPIVLGPLLILGVADSKVFAWSALTAWQLRFYHANIRTNMGWLRTIFVTPQSHRIHHSVEERHFDKNFGVIFSFWDRLFGTHYAGVQEYPKTGIRDAAFPAEARVSPVSLLLKPIQQTVYPFYRIVKPGPAGRE